jgi:hypothetical protein
MYMTLTKSLTVLAIMAATITSMMSIGVVIGQVYAQDNMTQAGNMTGANITGGVGENATSGKISGLGDM